MAKVFNYMVWDILTDKCLPGNYMATKEHIARIEGSFVIPNSNPMIVADKELDAEGRYIYGLQYQAIG